MLIILYTYICTNALLLLFSQERDYYNVGMYVAASIIQGGSGFPFLAEPVYAYLCTGNTTGITLSNNDIPHTMLKLACEKVCDNV